MYGLQEEEEEEELEVTDRESDELDVVDHIDIPSDMGTIALGERPVD